MATSLLSGNQYFTTTLNVGGGIDASQTTGIIVADVSGLDTTKPGMALINYATPLNTSICEWIEYTSINGSKELQGVIRGSEGFSAKTHSNGVSVAFPLSESHINRLATALSIGASATNGVEGVLDEDDMATNSATKLATQQSIKAYVDTSVAAVSSITTNQITIIPFPYPSASQGTPTMVTNTAISVMGVSMQSGGTLNDYNEWKFYARSGTYKFKIVYGRGNNFGIVTTTIDGGSSLGTHDGYAASTDFDQVVEYTGVVLTSGEHTIRLQSTSKHASSSAYFNRTQLIQFLKTA